MKKFIITIISVLTLAFASPVLAHSVGHSGYHGGAHFHGGGHNGGYYHGGHNHGYGGAWVVPGIIGGAIIGGAIANQCWQWNPYVGQYVWVCN